MTNTDAKSMCRSWHDILPEIRADNQAWRAEHLPRLRAEQAIKDARREAGRAALAAIEPEHRAAIIAAYGGPL